MTIAIGGGTVRSLPVLAPEHDGVRMSRYAELLAFYNRDQWDGRRRAGETRRVYNYARTFVRKSASYLFTREPAFGVLADDGSQVEGSERVEGILSDYYARHDLFAADYALAIDSAVLGDGVCKVVYSARLGRPVVAAVDPRTVLAWPWSDDPTDYQRVEQRLDLSVEEARAIYGLDGPLPGSAPSSPARVVVCERWTPETLEVEVSGEVVKAEPNAYGYCPYVIFPNVPRPMEFWGESDLVDLMDVCRELNERLGTLSRIMQVSGYPITVLEGVEQSEGIMAQAGAVWEIPQDSKAYLLDMLAGQGVRLHVEFIDQLRLALHDIGETPRTAFGDSGRTLSGAALEVEIQPLVQKVTRKRRVWDGVYRRRNAMLLDQLERFAGVQGIGGLRRTVVHWGSILPSDRSALVTEETQLVGAGVHSRRRAMVELGEEDPDALVEEILAEARQFAAVNPPMDPAAERAGGSSETGDSPTGAKGAGDADNAE